MAKIETVICAIVWGLMNGLLIAVTLGAATPQAAAPAAIFGHSASVPIA